MTGATQESRPHHIQKSVLFDKQYAPLRALKDTDRKAFDGFLFHDLQNTVTGPPGFVAMAQAVVDREHGVEGTSPTLKKIQEYNNGLLEKATDVENRRVRMDEFSTYMHGLAQFAASPDIQELANRPTYAFLKQELAYLPTSAFLVDCFVQTMRYFEHPNQMQLAQLEQMKGPSIKQILSKFKNVEVVGEDFTPNGIESIMFYTSAHKFAAEYDRTKRVDGISVTFSKDEAGRFVFQSLEKEKQLPYKTYVSPDRFARYALPDDKREPVTAAKLQEREFSQGLLATELLGYMTQKNLRFEKIGERPQFVIEPFTSRFEKRILHEVGEPAGIRRLDVFDVVDLVRAMEIDNPGIIDRRGKIWPHSTQYYEKLKQTIDAYVDKEALGEREIYAVTAQVDESTGKPFTSENRGEVDGVIEMDFSKNARETYEKMSGVKILPSDISPIELSYKNRKKGPSHLMASGIRQLCGNLLRADNESAVSENQRATTADRIVFNDFSSRRIIYTKIDPADTDAIVVMAESGFLQSGETEMYVLDWDRMHQMSEEVNEGRIKQRLSQLMQQPQLNTNL